MNPVCVGRLVSLALWLSLRLIVMAGGGTPGSPALSAAVTSEAEGRTAENAPPRSRQSALDRRPQRPIVDHGQVHLPRIHHPPHGSRGAPAVQRGRRTRAAGDQSLPSDIRIFDNQSAVRRIRQFSRLDDLPLQVGILLDVSDSVQKTASREKLADAILRATGAAAADRPRLPDGLRQGGEAVAAFDRRSGALRQAVEQIQQLGYTTNLYDGLFAACLDHFPQTNEQAVVQRIIVLFSDGEDTGSLHGLPDAIAMAQRNEIQIFALSIHPAQGTPGDEVLKQTGRRNRRPVLCGRLRQGIPRYLCRDGAADAHPVLLSPSSRSRRHPAFTPCASNYPAPKDARPRPPGLLLRSPVILATTLWDLLSRFFPQTESAPPPRRSASSAKLSLNARDWSSTRA